MIQSGAFWLTLATSVVGYWLLPLRWRMWFLALVSVGYVASLDWRSATVLVGWSALFYLSAPLLSPERRERAGALPTSRHHRNGYGSVGQVNGGSAPTAVLAAPPVQVKDSIHEPLEPWRFRSLLLAALIVGILLYLCAFKYLLPHLHAGASAAASRGPANAADQVLVPLGISYFT